MSAAFERWSARRKQEVVALIVAGHTTAEEARAQYRISEEELAAWRAGRVYASTSSAVNPARHLEAIRQLRAGHSVATIADNLGLSVVWVYRLRKNLAGAENANPRAPLARLAVLT